MMTDSPVNGGRTRVLLVDDDPATLRLIERKLNSCAVKSDCATSAEEALIKMVSNMYTVVVSDVLMPGMNGVEMVSAMKKHSPLVQVIMLTSDGTMQRVIDAVDRGAVDFFSKSEDYTLLVDSVLDSLARADRWSTVMNYRNADNDQMTSAAGY